ncbi:hypothetical protein EYF80_014301 [Liparis tanakae]|uniref:Uncharacterized protein n=1 Tax=Liparis tanakae TaxID=230148 RepID=A0A4Z2IBS1_9TELE|nr:hypothetical protein EYF80_014301 [Liparis tanakae]
MKVSGLRVTFSIKCLSQGSEDERPFGFRELTCISHNVSDCSSLYHCIMLRSFSSSLLQCSDYLVPAR